MPKGFFWAALGAQLVPKLYLKSSKRRQLLEILGKMALIYSKMVLNVIKGINFVAVLIATLVTYADKFLSIICYTEQWAAVTRGWD